MQEKKGTHSGQVIGGPDENRARKRGRESGKSRRRHAKCRPISDPDWPPGASIGTLLKPSGNRCQMRLLSRHANKSTNRPAIGGGGATFGQQSKPGALSAIIVGLTLLPLLLFATPTATQSSLPASAQTLPFQQHQYTRSQAADEDLATASSGGSASVAFKLPLPPPPPTQTPPEAEQTGNNGRDLFTQAALVSASNVLAFWRPSHLGDAENEPPEQWRPRPAGNGANKWSQPSKKCLGVHSANASQPNGGGDNNLYLSALLAIGGSQNPFAAAQKSNEPPAELLAIEGTTLKLNFVIIGHRLGPLTSSNQAPVRIHIHWTRNGNNEPVQVNGPQARHSRFSQLFINENDLIRQHFASSSSSKLSAADEPLQFVQFHNGSFSLKSPPAPSVSRSATAHPIIGEARFVLAPHLDESQCNRLAESSISKLQFDLRRLRNALAKQPIQLDDFLADGQSIDWQKLESYLRHRAEELRFILPSSGDECQAAFSLDQLTIVQVEMSQLNIGDRGVYKLHACQATGQSGQGLQNCQKTAFKLHIVEDLPKLESRPDSQILDVGDRMSIKCEATGFTLPQITWYLDGQQLNEHQQQSAGIGASDGSISPSVAMVALDGTNLNNHLRIGDYVSQDNHVHSFVNTSQVTLADGGFYKCQANNGFHVIEHETRVDVSGPPTISRRLSNVSALIGSEQLRIQCPYAGYPISGVEWLYRPGSVADSSFANQRPSRSSRSKRVIDTLSQLASDQLGGGSKRRPQMIRSAAFPDVSPTAAAAPGDGENTEPDPSDPDKDDWLAQAGAMTPPGPEDYPESLPDYPPSGAGAPDGRYQLLQQRRPEYQFDYSDIPMDLQQEVAEEEADDPVDGTTEELVHTRKRRSLSAGDPSGWTKYPQSRRHQVHSNGTLIIQDIGHGDQGFYKCRVIQQTSPRESSGDLEAERNSNNQYLIATSNEFHLTVLVPPVISPITSAESLREGMRNFLTCSVIEGDSPVRLHWLKDGRPIEEHIRQAEMQQQTPANLQSQLARIRVETTNEYTSTLYFSHVDFKDNGNYTCVATNKAASVNYTTRMLVNVPPKWIKTPQDLECTAGGNIVIDCQAQAHPNARIWWEIGVSSAANGQPETHVRSISGSDSISRPAAAQVQPLANQHPPNHYRTIVSNSRIHILENASLVIRDVNKQDQGFYLCQAANNFGSLSALIKLTVNVGASFAGKYAMKYVKLNEPVELDCDPIGQAPVSVTWYMRHLLNQLNRSTSSLPPLDPQASGSATSGPIIAYNIQQAKANQSLHHHRQQQSLGRRLFTANIRTELQHNVASASAAAASTLGPPLKSSHFDIISDEMAATHLDSTMSLEIIRRPQDGSELARLVIRQAQRQHSAEFTCQAANQFGSDEKLIKLLVQEPPDPIQEASVVQIDSRSVSIAWIAPYNGNSPISGYTVEWTPVLASGPALVPTKWSQVVVQSPMATIAPLKPMTSYEIRIVAHNQLGRSATPSHAGGMSPVLLVSTLEEAPTTPPGDIKVVALSSSTLLLSWLPLAQHSAESQHSPIPTSASMESKKSFSIKGYYLGYKIANSNDSFVFKTVSLMDNGLSIAAVAGEQLIASSDSIEHHAIANKSLHEDRGRIRVSISDLRRSTKYSIIVQAFNSAGPGPQSDIIEAKTLANDPPPAPLVRVGMITYTSIELLWTFASSQLSFDSSPGILESQMLSLTSVESQKSSVREKTHQKEVNSANDISVEGYQLFYKLASSSEWTERKLTPETHVLVATNHLRNDLSIVDRHTSKGDQSQQQVGAPEPGQSLQVGWTRNATGPLAYKTFRHVLDQLACGNSYQIYLIAYNSIGSSLPSQIVRTKTRGSVPIAPRRQDYIVQNSTYVQLNLEAWMDGGCSISNFEIRYRPLATGGRASADSNSGNQWLLVPNSVSPDQRVLEIPDLKPESWYSTLTIAESAAGRTESQYNFMTLDKFGQLPAEAMEPSNLPALFRSSGSIRSILSNFSSASNGGAVSPLLLSACLCLLLLASCSVFIIRRYNNLFKDNASSIDSRTTSGAFSSRYNVGAAMLGDAGLDHHAEPHHGRHHHQRSDYNGTQEHYSMKVSPCKTTSTSVLTGSSNNSSSATQACESSANCHLVGNHQCDIGGNQAASCRQTANENQSYPSQAYYPSCELQMPVGKFATLAREDQHNSAQASVMNRFKTLPHNAQRPLSTFLSGVGAQQQHVCTTDEDPLDQTKLCNGNMSGMEQHQLLNDYQHHQQLVDQQQQIYSKLRLFYSTNNNYNLCPEKQLEHNLSSDRANELLYNADAFNMAVLATKQHHQQRQDMIAALNKRQLSSDQPAVFLDNNNRHESLGQMESMKANEATLTSLLMDCQHQQLDGQANGHLTSGLSGTDTGKHDATGALIATGEGFSDLNESGFTSTSGGGPSSVASGSVSTSNSGQPTASSSLLTGNQHYNQSGPHMTQDQIMSLTAGNSTCRASNNQLTALLAKSMGNGIPATGQQQQALQANPQQSGEQHSDYALPFPPKWV